MSDQNTLDFKAFRERIGDLRGKEYWRSLEELARSDAFDELPTPARDAIYRRMYAVLSGEERAPRYSRLSASDRRAIIDILRDTKRGLPSYFR